MLGLAVLGAMVRLAWLGDDAYITLRTVENALAGHGPVWNAGERVQTFTHPLWFGLLLAVRWLTGGHYMGTLVLSIACSAIGVVLLALLARRPLAIAAVLVGLLSSRAFLDYTTSGLETPLAIVLLAALALVDDRAAPGQPRLLAVGLLAALLGVTRLDLLLLAGPVLLVHLRLRGVPTQAARLLLALAPLLLWSLFATFYYGSPFPITAWAKAFGPGLPAGELGAQGLCYVEYSLRRDPATLAVIAAGVLAGLCAGRLRGRMLALGVLLSCAYVVRVGGDFMAGRFFVPPFVVAVALLARALRDAGAWPQLAFAGAAAALAFLPGRPAFLTAPAADEALPPEHGIQDERRFWAPFHGLLSPHRAELVPGRFSTALRRQGRQRPIVLGVGAAGAIPFEAGDLFHFVDPWLCDPLLMRLPVAEPGQWRIGHFTRAWPEGYAASIASGENRLRHPGLASFYDPLRLVLRANLLAPERWRALAELLTGARDAGLLAYIADDYRTPPRPTMPWQTLPSPAPEGAFWFDEPATVLPGRGGVRVALPELRTAGSLHATVAPFARYRFTFFAGDRAVGSAELSAVVDPGLPPPGDDGDMLGYLRGLVGFRRWTVPLPAGLPAFDAIEVDTLQEPWTVPALGGLEIAP